MPYELFLALRYLTARRRGRAAARVTALAALVGIACGVAALTVALALANGFRDEMRAKILRGTAHITLTRADAQPITNWPALVARLRAVPGVTDVAPTTYNGALLCGPDNNTTYAVLRGIAPDALQARAEIHRTLVVGDADALFRSNDDSDTSTRAADEPAVPAIIGAELAARTGLVRVGDEGWLVAGEWNAAAAGFTPNTWHVRVVGLFRTGLYEFDASWVYVPLASAVSLSAAAQGSAPVISLETADIFRTPETAARVRATLGAEYATVDWQEANRPLFAALALERRMLGLIITLILFVAALNITTTLVLVVVERRADIAILGAIGAHARSVMLVFVIEGALIGAVGALAGTALGLFACYLGDRYGLVRLSAEVYSLSAIPFHPRAGETALAALGAFVICLLATLYPARAAARLKPAEALRYE